MTSAREENLKNQFEEKVISVNPVYPGIISLIARESLIDFGAIFDQKFAFFCEKLHFDRKLG